METALCYVHLIFDNGRPYSLEMPPDEATVLLSELKAGNRILHFPPDPDDLDGEADIEFADTPDFYIDGSKVCFAYIDPAPEQEVHDA